ncbi:hypothetical protein DENIS_4727 [Desulfonema ishimotonii]|uniref:Uncharacterized protein n=1 Tax=Desulfonema ishimotonii TaxID=45657 RepID=A0A401G3B4_9BACT|nr:hypothetical protein DENIS_4727 [Desulfonema ishimotonii]
MLLFQLISVFPVNAGASGPSAFIEFICIDANVGASSGGHIALRLGETVYHFQHFPDRMFRMVREPWPHFRYIYNDLENRSLHIARIRLSAPDCERISDHLLRRYLIQNSQFDTLAGLAQDCALIRSFLGRERCLSLRGVGLFDPEQQEDAYAGRLRGAVFQKHGGDFLKKEIAKADRALTSEPIAIPDRTWLCISRDRLPGAGDIYARRYTDLLLKREALAILARARPLADGILCDPASFDTGHESALFPAEREQLAKFAEALLKSVPALVASRRPDSGYPLLVAIARYQAVQRALAANRLMVADPFSCNAARVQSRTVAEKRTVAERLARRARRKFEKIRSDVFSGPRISEADYNRLENSAGRYYEIQRGLAIGESVRVEQGGLIPSASGPVPLLPPNRNRERLAETLALAEANYNAFLKQLRAACAYHILRANCATELVRVINSSFDSHAEAATALGGELNPGDALGYIPFRLSELVRERWRVTGTYVLPSYRRRQVAKMYALGHPVAVYFREFNTLSSTVYEPVDGDSAFFFFTDDIFWPRPFYGLMNIAYGIADAGAGLLSLPADRGNRLTEGLRGVLFSLPELIFCNIRKGSFDFVEETVEHPFSRPAERSEPAFNRRVAP